MRAIKFFTIKNKGGIILDVKSKFLLLTTLAAVVAAATISTGAAFADEPAPAEPQYPADFVRTLDLSADGLTDYAISGNKCALAGKTTVYVLTSVEGSDGSTLESTNVGTEVTALDYFEGKLYYKIASGNAYEYPAVPDSSQPVEHEFPASVYSVTIGDFIYTLNNKDELKLFNNSTREDSTIEGVFGALKVYDGVAYAVKDNCPQKLDGGTAIPVSLKYTDFSPAKEVATGTIADKLKDPAYTVKTATLKASSAEQNRYYTCINAEKIGEVFETVGDNHTVKATTKACLVLAEEGNLSVIVMDGNCYITATDNLEETAYSSPANDWPAGENGERKAYIRESAGIYASPYMCSSTLVARVAADTPVTATVKEKFALDFFGSHAIFYRVEYAADEQTTVSGFVAAGFLDEYDYSADMKEPTPGGTEGFVYDTNVTTVILVLVVVGLVIIAIAYLTIVGTRPSKKSKKSAKNTSKSPSPDDEE